VPRRRTMWIACAAMVLALAQTGCTFFACSGGGPLRRGELGDWAGIAAEPIPSAQDVTTRMAALKGLSSNTFAGRYSMAGDSGALAFGWLGVASVPFTPAPGLMIKGRMNPWLRLLPCTQRGDWLYYDRGDKAARQFYAVERSWSVLLAGGNRADAWDAASRQRVAAERTDEVIGLGLGWTRTRHVLPVDRVGDAGLNVVRRTRIDLDQARYQLKDGNILLLGIVGWGRVNHHRYLQLLWIPIDLGTVRP